MIIPWSVGLFVLAGPCEIGGGYLVWLWLREGKSLGDAVAGAVILILYGVITPRCNRPISGGCMRPMAERSSCSRYSGARVWMARAQTDSTYLEHASAWWAWQ